MHRKTKALAQEWRELGSDDCRTKVLLMEERVQRGREIQQLQEKIMALEQSAKNKQRAMAAGLLGVATVKLTTFITKKGYF